VQLESKHRLANAEAEANHGFWDLQEMTPLFIYKLECAHTHTHME